jgi:hypothetical protein
VIETEYVLETSATGVIGASGSVVVTDIGPARPGERWVITNTSVTSSANCVFQTFRGRDALDSRQIDYTEQGKGDSSDTKIELSPQGKICVKWTGAVGVSGTVVFTGSSFVPGRRAY